MLDPYLLGIVLGDGSIHNGSICVTTADNETVEYIQQVADCHGLRLQEHRAGGKSKTYYLYGEKNKRNPVTELFRRYNLGEVTCEFKFIPPAFKMGTRHERLMVLAGLMDTDGSLSGTGFDFISKSNKLASDVVFVARSLGLAAYLKECEKRDQNGNGGTYWRVSISGDCGIIPCRIARKQAPERLQKKNVCRTGFKIEPLGTGEYFGFTLDGDGRYLLDDFTVTHNTGKTRLAKNILGAYLNREKRENESGHALFAVHRRGLVDNASASFRESPELPHGLIMAGCETMPGRNIQVASIDTKNSWYCEDGIYRTDFTYDMVVFDETHAHISKLRTFLEAHDKKRAELGLAQTFVLGLSATPQHKELNKVFKEIVNGPSPQWLIDNKFLSPFRYFQCTQGQLQKLVKQGDEYTSDSVSEAMSGLAGDLVRDWKRLAQGRATVGFFPRRSHAQDAMELLRANDIDAHYVDGETDDDERRKLYRWLNEGVIDYLCNVGVVERGTDIPRIGCVQMCTAVGSVVRWRQMIGRGSRVHPDVEDCIVLDHADGIRKHGFFEDDIQWTLEWGERPSKTHEARPSINCPRCSAIYRGGRCRACGYEPTAKERKSQGLTFVGGELKEVNKKTKESAAKKSNEELMIQALYIAGKRNLTFGQSWWIAKQMAEKQGTHFQVPATFVVAGKRYKTIPHGHWDSRRKVRDIYGFTRQAYGREDNPYLVGLE
jgi:superfamily II DNA or RNA helicase